MRNLKRALSLALASIMLLGMMVVGTSAASTTFADDADIVNSEAAAITAGLGIFAGADGKFNPTEIVTRAQMATIIVKMLYGSDVNADIYKGTNEFNDVADYQGGWAEGYINLCASLKIVSGYGNKTFKPGNPVTTAEAVTMIINALSIDAGEGTWPATVMAKASELKLFGDLTLATNAGLTRDNLAVLVLEGLKYSPKGETTVYTVTETSGKVTTFTSASEAYFYQAANAGSTLTAQTTSAGSLADTVFKMKNFSGVLTANGANTASFAADAANDVKATTVVGNRSFIGETGLDLIGHKVTVYYKEVKNVGDVAYAFVDNSKEVVLAKKENQTAAQVKSLLGLSTLPTAAITPAQKVVNYAVSDNADAVVTLADGKYTIPAGTYIVTDGVLAAKKSATSDIVVLTINVTNRDKGYYTVKAGSTPIVTVSATSTAADDKDLNNIDWMALASKTAATTNVAMKVNVVNGGQYYNIAPVSTVTGKVTLISTKITVNGKAYEVAADTTAAGTISGSFTTMDNTTLDFTNEFTFYLDEAGKIFAAKKITNADTKTYVPVYVIGTTEVPAGTDAYGAAAYNYNVQYYNLDGTVALAKYASLAGKTVVNNPGTSTTKVAYSSAKINDNGGAAAGWYLMATTEAGAALKALSSSYTNGYKVVDVVLGAELDMKATTTKLGTALITANSNFLYSTATTVKSTNAAATVKVGAHASDDIPAGTYKVVVSKNASNADMYDIVGAWMGKSFATATNDKIVYVASSNGQVGIGATEAKNTWSFTVYALDGTKEDIVITGATAPAVAGTFQQVKKAANGALSFATPIENDAFNKTGALADTSPAKTAYYTVDGTNYLNIDGNDCVVNNTVVIDLRSANDKKVVPAIDSVIGMLGLEKTVDFTCAYKTASGIKTVTTIVIYRNTPAAP